MMPRADDQRRWASAVVGADRELGGVALGALLVDEGGRQDGLDGLTLAERREVEGGFDGHRHVGSGGWNFERTLDAVQFESHLGDRQGAGLAVAHRGHRHPHIDGAGRDAPRLVAGGTVEHEAGLRSRARWRRPGWVGCVDLGRFAEAPEQVGEPNPVAGVGSRRHWAVGQQAVREERRPLAGASEEERDRPVGRIGRCGEADRLMCTAPPAALASTQGDERGQRRVIDKDLLPERLRGGALAVEPAGVAEGWLGHGRSVGRRRYGRRARSAHTRPARRRDARGAG